MQNDLTLGLGYTLLSVSLRPYHFSPCVYVKIFSIKKKTYIYIYIYILSFKAQLITNVYLNRKTLNLIIKNYPKQ